MCLNSCYVQIHQGERELIEQLYRRGYTAGKIARNIFRSRSTIWREISRNGYEGRDGKWYYSAKVAQLLYNKRQRKADRRKKQWPGITGSIRDEFYRRSVYYNILRAVPPGKVRGPHENAWLRVYPESDWQYTAWATEWRDYYNRKLRRRDYWWEEKKRRTRYLDREEHNKDRKYRPDWQYIKLLPLFPKRRKHKPRKIFRYKRAVYYESSQPAYPFPKASEESKLIVSRSTEVSVETFITRYPAVSPQPAGKTMPAPQIFGRILKIPALFHRGSPHFLLNCG